MWENSGERWIFLTLDYQNKSIYLIIRRVIAMVKEAKNNSKKIKKLYYFFCMDIGDKSVRQQIGIFLHLYNKYNQLSPKWHI